MQDGLERFHRHSIRYSGYDYSQPGAYFVTVVACGHKCIFGKSINSEVHISNLGEIVHGNWQQIPNHFSNVEVDPFIIMPNHVHGIITIHEDDCRGTIYRAPTKEEFGKPVRGSIPTIIRTFKAAVSRTARRELGMVNIWQRNYYEHILRNPSEMQKIALYIENNPNQWADDPEFQS